MSFEVKEEDLLARIGKLKTKSGTVETPLLFPVINPSRQPISTQEIAATFGFEALITNAFILKQCFGQEVSQKGLHKFLNFGGPIMTDSGAYQILVYGDVHTNPEEIVEYQEQIDTDIATILDIPTSWHVKKEDAQKTVEETLNRARQFFQIKTRDDILWVGPIQGGRYLDLVAQSARKMAKLHYEIHALGSPTEVMERYRFDVLVEMILTAKMNLPIDRPLHLFGAGHPFMFSLAVALGCDLFDSAAYSIYAKEDRYMTETGTARLDELEYFPCQCPKCASTNPQEVMKLPKLERQTLLAKHNLYVCNAELRRIKQAIKDGRLWEHMEMRAHSHPALLQAIKKLAKYKEFIEKHSPATRSSGLFYFDSTGLARPEIVRYSRRLRQNYTRPRAAKTLILIPQTEVKPFHKAREYKQIRRSLYKTFDKASKPHVCFYAAPFGIIPLELDEMYPLSQHETSMPLDKETIEHVATQVVDYLRHTSYDTVILIHDAQNWNNTILNICKETCRKNKNNLKTVLFKRSLNQQFKVYVGSRFLPSA